MTNTEKHTRSINIEDYPGLTIRFSVYEDIEFLRAWLREPGVLKGFPIATDKEIDENTRFWMGFYKYKSSLTALFHGEPCGIATLNLMPYEKMKHQGLLSFIVGEKYRNKGIGTVLVNNLLHLAKESFCITTAYIEVYEENPAISLYKRFGFKEIGFQAKFLIDGDRYIGKILMERDL